MALRIGHRGFPTVAPANTLGSFRAAYEAGCDWVECDCRASSDGVVVLAHDEEVTDSAGRVWVIREHLAPELRGLDFGFGEGVPEMRELVEWASGRVGVMADVKQNGCEPEIAAALAPLPADRRIVAGADSAARRRFRSLEPGLRVSTTLGLRLLVHIDALLSEVDTDAVTLEYPLITAARVQHLHARGIRVYAWTVDELPAMRALVAMGVDGLISNRADLLTRV